MDEKDKTAQKTSSETATKVKRTTSQKKKEEKTVVATPVYSTLKERSSKILRDNK